MSDKIERQARLRWVPIVDMRVSPLAQRELNQSRVNKIAAEFDLEQIGAPTVNKRDGLFYVIDGQHRIEALKVIGWGDQQIEAWTYAGLTEEEEAEKFLKLNDTLQVHAFAKFKIGVQAGRVEENDIDRIVRACELHISTNHSGGSVSAVGALRRVYSYGPGQLHRTLCIIRDAYGDAGMESTVISGLGLLCARYGSALDDAKAVDALSHAHGSVGGLKAKAEMIRRVTGRPKYQCVAAAAVEIINGRRGGRKLQAWEKTEETAVVVAVAG